MPGWPELTVESFHRWGRFLLLSAILSCVAAAASAQSVVRPRLPQDQGPLDLILRSSDDPDLLTPRQAILREKSMRMGVDPKNPSRPSLTTLFSRRIYDRAKVDPFAAPRRVESMEIDWEHRLVVVFDVAEGDLFDAPADTNLIGIAFHEARDFGDSTVTVRVHSLTAWQRYWVSVGLDEDWAFAVAHYQAQAASSDPALNFRIPIKMPRTLERIIGRGDATSIHISGTETIKIGGESTVRNDFIGNEIQQNQSLFPSLEMEQTLRVNLDGTVGEKIKVRVTHNSAATFGQEATEVKLEFVGDEDDIIQNIRAGNIDVTLPGSGLLGVPASRGGLFGIRVSGAVGPLDYTLFTSKEQSQQGKTSFNATGGTPNDFRIASTDYIKDRFFRLNAPRSLFFTDQDSAVQAAVTDNWAVYESLGWHIDHTSIELYKSISIQTGSADEITTGIAVLDREGNGWETPTAPVDPQTLGEEGTGYVKSALWQRLEIWRDWAPLVENQTTIGFSLSASLGRNQALAASYLILDANDQVVRRVGRRAFVDADPTILDPNPIGEPEEVYFFKLIRPISVIEPLDQDGNPDPGAFPLTWEYMYRHFYDLGGSGISEDNITLRIETLGNEDYPEQDVNFVDWIRHFGLDTRGQGSFGEPDGIADFFDPVLFNLEDGYVQFPSSTPFALGNKVLDPRDVGLFAEAEEIYQKVNQTDINRHRVFDIVGSHTSTSSRLRLPAFNLKEGSEEVILSGRTLQRGTDYEIDYFSGEITLTGAAALLDAQSNLEVRYEVDPLFGGGRTSLHGVHLSYELGDQKRINTTWLLNSQPSQARKARFGEEPSKSWVGNLSTKFRFTPFFLTRMANWLPRVNSNEASVVNFDAEVAVSIPNPNPLRTGYIEDFEAADNDISLPMSREGWVWASLPAQPDTLGPGRRFGMADRVFTRWHRQQPSVLREELNPILSERERNDIVPTLAMRMISNDAISNSTNAEWQPNEFGGIMRGFPGDVDLTHAQFLEFWINDLTGDVPASQREGTLHFDFGIINEDYWWTFQPDTTTAVKGDLIQRLGIEDSEDGNFSGILDGDEDRGLDQIWNGLKHDRDSEVGEALAFPILKARGSDAAGDDFDSTPNFDTDPDIRDDTVLKNEPFLYINGTEGNRSLDKEDLNNDTLFNLRDGYYSIALDLSDPNPLVDVYRDYAGQGAFLAEQRSKKNAWRKYRIDLRNLPIVRAEVEAGIPYQPTQPDLSRVSHFRIWYENSDPNAIVRKRNPAILFAEMKFIGNRWLSDGLRDSLNQRLDPAEVGAFEDFRVGVVNNKENPDYNPPVFPDTRNNIAEKEQSLQLVYTNLQEGHGARVRQELAGGVAQDLLLYEQLAYFWRAPHDADGVRDELQDEMEAFYWVGSDSTNYYEISLRFAALQARADGWQECRIDLGELTNVKFEDTEPADLDSTFFVRQGIVKDTLTGEPYRVTVRGRPDLRRVKRYYAGIRNPTGSGMGAVSGDILFNEVRLTHVDRDVGYAKSLSLNANIKGLGNFGFTWDQTDPSFRGLDKKRGSNIDSRSWSAKAGTALQNLVPTLGFDVPISGQMRRSSSLPRYQSNTDIELLDETLRKEEETTNDNESVNLQLRRTNPSERWWLKYTVDRASFGLNSSRSRAETPVNLTSRKSSQQKYTYDLRIPGKGAELSVPLLGWEFHYLPNQFSVESTWSFDETENAQKILEEGATERQLIQRPTQTTKKNQNRLTLGQTFAPNLRSTFTVSSDRDLARRDDVTGEIQKNEVLGLFDFGKEDSYAQALNINYQPQLPVLSWFGPDIQYNTRYSEDRKPGIRQRAPNSDDALLGEAGEVRHVNNGSQLSFRGKADLTGWFKKRYRGWRTGREREEVERREAEEEAAAAADSLAGALLEEEPAEERTPGGALSNLPVPGGPERDDGGGRPAATPDSSASAGEDFDPMRATARLFKPFARLVSDLEPFNLNLTLNRGSNFKHVNRRANALYRFGWIIGDDPKAAGFDTPVAPGQPVASNSGRRKEWSIDLTTRSALSDNVRIDTSFQERRSEQLNSASPPRQTFSREFPQFKLTVNNVHNWRLFTGWFQQASMNLTAKKSEEYQSSSGSDKYPKISWSWQPRWNMTFHNGLTSSLNFQISSDRQDNSVNLLENSSFRTNVTLQKSFDARGALGFLRFGKEGVGSNIDMNVDAGFTQNRSVSTPLRTTNRNSTRSGRRTFSLSPKFNYQFSRNLRGGMELRYSRNTDLERKIASGEQSPVTQSFGLFFNATLNF